MVITLTVCVDGEVVYIDRSPAQLTGTTHRESRFMHKIDGMVHSVDIEHGVTVRNVEKWSPMEWGAP
jgi:hypothetical protein